MEEKTIGCDYVLSSMPLRDLGKAVTGMPPDVEDVCLNLSYRSMIVVAMSFPKDELSEGFARIGHDDWVYLQDDSVRAGRCQILNNWSPRVVPNEKDVLLELEYYCDEDDALWCSTDSDLLEQAIVDFSHWGICKTGSILRSVLVKRIPDAYPVYSGAYGRLSKVRSWADGIENLLCIGRNGQHKYNNMDHSVMVGMRAAQILLNHPCDKGHIWDSVGDEAYLEETLIGQKNADSIRDNGNWLSRG